MPQLNAEQLRSIREAAREAIENVRAEGHEPGTTAKAVMDMISSADSISADELITVLQFMTDPGKTMNEAVRAMSLAFEILTRGSVSTVFKLMNQVLTVHRDHEAMQKHNITDEAIDVRMKPLEAASVFCAAMQRLRELTDKKKDAASSENRD